MLRTDMNTIVAFLKDRVRPTVAGMKRGYITMDAAGLVTWGFAYANLQRIGTFLGIDIIRLAALGDGYLNYYDTLLNLIHETLLVSATGAFTVADQTYTDNGKCGVFSAGGGETIIISGSLLNNGTFLTASATANTVVVTSGFVEEVDAPSTTFTLVH